MIPSIHATRSVSRVSGIRRRRAGTRGPTCGPRRFLGGPPHGHRRSNTAHGVWLSHPRTFLGLWTRAGRYRTVTRRLTMGRESRRRVHEVACGLWNGGRVDGTQDGHTSDVDESLAQERSRRLRIPLREGSGLLPLLRRRRIESRVHAALTIRPTASTTRRNVARFVPSPIYRPDAASSASTSCSMDGDPVSPSVEG